VRLVLGPKAFEAKKVTFKVTHASAGVVAAIEALGGKVDMPKAEETKADA
jgi:large subunit ribosomal protein L15